VFCAACARDATPPAHAATIVEPPDAATTALPTVTAPRDLETLFPHGAPALPPPLSDLGIRLGMTSSELRAIYDQTVRGWEDAAWCIEKLLPHHPDACLALEWEGPRPGSISQLSLLFRDPPRVRRAMTGAWGAPRFVTDDTSWWFEGDLRVRLRFEKSDSIQVDYETFVPASRLLGEKGRALAFEKRPILGSTVSDVEADFSDTFHREDGGGGTILFPPTELEYGVTVVQLRVDAKGRIDRISTSIAHRDVWRGALLALFAKKWGTPVADGRSSVYAGRPRVTVTPFAKSFDIVVEPK
jgi:hypothetical protein